MRRVGVEAREVVGDVGGEAHLGGLHGVLRCGPGHGDVGVHAGALGAQALFVLAHGVVGALCARVAALPLDLVPGNRDLREREVKERLAVGAKAHFPAGHEDLSVVHEALEVDEPAGRVALAREGRGEVEVNDAQLAGGKHLADAHAGAGDKDDVGQPRLEASLRGVGDTDGLGVHADEQHVGLAARGLDGKGALAAAEVEADLRERFAAGGRAGGGPGACPGVGVRLDVVAVALEALLEDEVLGQARVQSVHVGPYLAGWDKRDGGFCPNLWRRGGVSPQFGTKSPVPFVPVTGVRRGWSRSRGGIRRRSRRPREARR